MAWQPASQPKERIPKMRSVQVACMFLSALVISLVSDASAMECKQVRFDSGSVQVCADDQGRLIAENDVWDKRITWDILGYRHTTNRRSLTDINGRRFELGLRPDGIVIWRPYKRN